MKDICIRSAEERDFSQILEMNEADVNMLSPIDVDLLVKIKAIADYFVVACNGDTVIGFMISYRDNSSYWSENYHWFADHFEKFLYIDRVVVNKDYRNHGFATLFYEQAFNYAHENSVPIIAAEIDIAPEYNTASMQFHRKMGFKEIGQRLFLGKVTVSLQIKQL